LIIHQKLFTDAIFVFSVDRSLTHLHLRVTPIQLFLGATILQRGANTSQAVVLNLACAIWDVHYWNSSLWPKLSRPIFEVTTGTSSIVKQHQPSFTGCGLSKAIFFDWPC